MEQVPFQHEKMGVGACQQKASSATLPLTDPCWGTLVQLDYDEEMGPLHGMCGSMEAEHEVQRTVKRTELTAFLVLSQKSEWTHQGPCGQ